MNTPAVTIGAISLALACVGCGPAHIAAGNAHLVRRSIDGCRTTVAGYPDFYRCATTTLRRRGVTPRRSEEVAALFWLLASGREQVAAGTLAADRALARVDDASAVLVNRAEWERRFEMSPGGRVATVAGFFIDATLGIAAGMAMSLGARSAAPLMCAPVSWLVASQVTPDKPEGPSPYPRPALPSASAAPGCCRGHWGVCGKANGRVGCCDGTASTRCKYRFGRIVKARPFADPQRCCSARVGLCGHTGHRVLCCNARYSPSCVTDGDRVLAL